MGGKLRAGKIFLMPATGAGRLGRGERLLALAGDPAGAGAAIGQRRVGARRAACAMKNVPTKPLCARVGVLEVGRDVGPRHVHADRRRRTTPPGPFSATRPSGRGDRWPQFGEPAGDRQRRLAAHAGRQRGDLRGCSCRSGRAGGDRSGAASASGRGESAASAAAAAAGRGPRPSAVVDPRRSRLGRRRRPVAHRHPQAGLDHLGRSRCRA